MEISQGQTDATTTPDNADAATGDETMLLNVDQVAKLFNCSPRHVYRLSDSGRMPRPVKLGALVRWPRQGILDWIVAGCPSCRRTGRW